ncbi:WD40 repeat-like protein [Xylariaceae sp. FL0662B]|nr:WD40 repeat-like protein [Xylariaceae sp. FL0662B]
MSQHPPAQPKSFLRGHRAQVYTTAFVRRNQRLASGDADGFVVLWDLTIMRPRAVWRAHTNAILGIADWGDDKIITYGRDNRIVVWKLTAHDESAMSTALPLDESAPERPNPWILHILQVNTMNFCSFASRATTPDAVPDELLIAVPNTLQIEAVDIFQLPSQNRQHTIHLGTETEKGMVMSLSLFWLQEYLTLAVAYESGLAIVAQLGRNGSWDVLYKARAHSQPVLSLDVSPDRDYFLTSGVDAIIAKHPIPTTTIHGPRSRVQTTKDDKNPGASSQTSLSAAPAPEPRPSAAATPKEPKPIVETQPLKVINTKHSGQQSLRIRSDGKIFATAGWDSKVRVYSAKTMSELAVLKWHDEGCYAVAFAVLPENKIAASGQTDAASSEAKEKQVEEESAAENNDTAVVTISKSKELSVKDRRIKMAKEAHWLAAGSKDGKISLWDVY